MSSSKRRLHIGLFIYILCIIAIGILLVPVFGGLGEHYAIGSYNLIPAVPQKEPVHTDDRILFVGDVMLGRDVERTLDRAGAAYPYRHMHEVFDTHTYQVANFEASIPSVHQPTPDFGYSFSVAREYAAALTANGFTHLSLANNHSFDFGIDGYESTHETLSQLGALPVGAPYNTASNSVAVLESGEVQVGLIALDLTLTEYNAEVIEKLFAYANRVSDMQIVYIHWGTEYSETHSGTQEKVARALIDAGADLIVGHHPHVVQDIARYDGVPVFYSLGNFIFDQYFSRAVQEGLMLSVDTDTRTIELLPITSVDTRVSPRMMDTNERERFFAQLTRVSEGEVFGEILDGRIAF